MADEQKENSTILDPYAAREKELQRQLAEKVGQLADKDRIVTQLRGDLQKSKDELSALKRQHEALEDSYEALRIQFKLAKPKYVWRDGDSKCQPVVRDGKCPTCGWTAKVRDDRNMPVPHPIM